MFCVKISAKGGTSGAFDIDSDQGASIEPPIERALAHLAVADNIPKNSIT